MIALEAGSAIEMYTPWAADLPAKVRQSIQSRNRENPPEAGRRADD